MKTGSFAGVTFSVSDQVVKTLNSFTWSTSTKWTTHQRLGTKELPEMTGKALDKATFGMTLSGYFGVNPMTQYKKLRDAVANGTVSTLVVGRAKVGTKWVATSCSLTATHYDREGAVASAEVKVTLQEYV